MCSHGCGMRSPSRRISPSLSIHRLGVGALATRLPAKCQPLVAWQMATLLQPRVSARPSVPMRTGLAPRQCALGRAETRGRRKGRGRRGGRGGREGGKGRGGTGGTGEGGTRKRTRKRSQHPVVLKTYYDYYYNLVLLLLLLLLQLQLQLIRGI